MPPALCELVRNNPKNLSITATCGLFWLRHSAHACIPNFCFFILGRHSSCMSQACNDPQQDSSPQHLHNMQAEKASKAAKPVSTPAKAQDKGKEAAQAKPKAAGKGTAKRKAGADEAKPAKVPFCAGPSP